LIVRVARILTVSERTESDSQIFEKYGNHTPLGFIGIDADFNQKVAWQNAIKPKCKKALRNPKAFFE
jgi:hypothetical protein